MNQIKSRQSGLMIVGAYTWLIGVLNTIGGASTDSRFYTIDNVVVRAIGVAFILLGLCLVRKQRWPVLPLAIVYGLSLVESLVTATSTQFPTIVLAALLFFGLPLLFLLRTASGGRQRT